MAVNAKGTMRLPSMFVFITRWICWNFSGMMSEDIFELGYHLKKGLEKKICIYIVITL